MFSLFPREEKFFEMFDRASRNLLEGGKVFVDLVTTFQNVEQKTKTLKDIEHEGDIITHEVMDKLNRTFVTPIDREDIHALTSALDDILDFILATGDRVHLYQAKGPNTELTEMSKILLECIEEIGRAIVSLKDLKRPRRILDYCVEINRLENDGDQVLKQAMAKLFQDSHDPISIIKWKEIYEFLEEAIDKCEDVANVIEGIVVKNA